MDDPRASHFASLFPLKTTLFAMKSSSTDRLKKKNLAKDIPQTRLRIRRGSSMSDLDKVAQQAPLPDLVRSTTANQQLCVSPAGSLPHSPYLSRSLLGGSTATNSVRGSIGDLMNQKRFGSSQWSVRSETLIAKMVPLSTVTPRHSPTPTRVQVEEADEEEEDICGPLTVAQRTKRLSRLIKRQRACLQWRNTMNTFSLPEQN
ncbi:hypothetical protein NQ315_003095 [Exocentrus adspersus]|uniref:Uncharacterized protein n=1 Tax=Exocentrus adspersus TaxID=1586481 RepID=A0AAV8W576_9CUCU|nr:hypothetical protein NQ315_003095 [Exocentrus adspersus]